MTTLGYHLKAQVVAVAKRNPSLLTADPDKRGQKQTESNALHEKIDKHIKSYNPSISHYRREHAPNRLYLPNELTICEMLTDYNEKSGTNPIHYSTYQRRIKAMNTSFAKFGEEECETCDVLKKSPDHDRQNGSCTKTECTPCIKLQQHMSDALAARQSCREDGDAIEGRAVRSVDLQKVVMLPRLPGFKSACSTKRLVAFHQTFAPIGKYCNIIKRESIIWHEAVAGQKADDIAASFVMALNKDRLQR